MADDGIKIYVSFEPHYQGCAERLSEWTHTNHDRALYNSRQDVPVDSSDAEPIKQVLRAQIEEAQVIVCLISQTTCLDDWIAWELETAKMNRGQRGLVGIVLNDHAQYPPAMSDSGAMFVSFRADLVAYAIEWAMTEHHTSEDFTLQDE